MIGPCMFLFYMVLAGSPGGAGGWGRADECWMIVDVRLMYVIRINNECLER